MGKVAFVFPGQGAQAIGMGLDAFEQSAQARAIFETADRVLGEPLSELIFRGEEAELKKTVNTQPALLTASIAYWTLLADAGIRADVAAGHSLGEYSALVASGALSFEEAVKTVRMRGQLMEQAVPAGLGGMAAILGAERDALKALCATISAEIDQVELANVNCPGQIVVSGSVAGVQAVADQVKSIGAKRAIVLEVSGPFHSSLMQPAADALAPQLASIAWQMPSVPVVSNVTALPVQQAEAWAGLLQQQIVSPVQWEDSVNTMIEYGVDTFVEIGPGSVLAGLIKKIDKQVTVHNVNSLESLQATITALQGVE
jgi:[acyl-carrier-protein] S-malonyltransferase